MKALNSHYNTKQAKKQPLHLKTSPAFTIVELLIVVVVIAILAAITIVSYNGITTRAAEATLKSDLRTAAAQLGISHTNNGSYPNPNLPGEVKPSDTTTLEYTSDGTTFCLSAFPSNANANISPHHITQDGTITTGACPGHTGEGGGEVTTTMQTFTPSQCQALTTFTGSNEEAIVTLQDPRGTTEADYRTYQVAKLADGNCWMLNNLKLGSTSGTLTLTPSDSDVASSFTLPQILSAGTATNYDTPYAFGPVPGDTGADATNYGYLYNWPAVTAGESRISHPASAGTAPNSICPAGWRLPTGDATGEFAWLNAKMNNPSASASSISGGDGFYQNWQNTGPFKGVFSGHYSGSSFSRYGVDGRLWSSSPYLYNANFALYVFFYSTAVKQSDYTYNRSLGFAVRCLLD